MKKYQWITVALIVLAVLIVGWEWYNYDPSPGKWGEMRLR
jgi:hypothetical protein